MGFFISLNDGFAERGLIRNGLTSLSEAPLYPFDYDDRQDTLFDWN